MSLNYIKVLLNKRLFVGCQKTIRITSDKPGKKYDLGDVLTCSTPSNHGHKQSYKWMDSNGVTVSNTSMITLAGEGSFNLTCTITDKRPACSVLRKSVNGHLYGKLIVNLNCYLIKEG